MTICGVCGKNSLFPETYGSLVLCKKCAMKIMTPTWKDLTYSTRAELEAGRDSVLKRARRAEFPQQAIDALKRYFDGRVIKGLIRIMDGGAGQNLAVFEDHFSIDTQDGFNIGEIERAYQALAKPGLRGHGAQEDRTNDFNIDSGVLAGAARDVLSCLSLGGGLGRGVLKAGAGIAAEAARKTQNNEAIKEDMDVELRISYGLKSYKFSDLEDISLRLPVDEEEYGFIQFQRRQYRKQSGDIFFFFRNISSRKKAAKEIYGYVQDKISDLVQEEDQKNKIKEEADVLTPQLSYAPSQLSAPDELMKWKELLDKGVITQKEFNAKKTQLLGL